MTVHRSLRKIALTCLISICCASLARADTLPRLEADSIGGQHVVLPTDASGEPLVLLVAFGKKSEGDVKSWSRRLLAGHVDQKAHVYVVVVVDGTGSMMRRHVRKIVQDAAVGPEAEIESNVLITFDGKPWSAVVPAGSSTATGVVVCNANGDIIYDKRVTFTDRDATDVESAVR